MIDLLRREPLTKSALAELAGCSTREVEAEVQRLRLSGVGIVSDSDGYRLPRDADDLATSNRRLRARLVTQYQTLRAQQRAERVMRDGEQLQLWRGAA